MQFALEMMFSKFQFISASVHDIHYLQDLNFQISDCVLLVDKSFLFQTIKLTYLQKLI